MVLGLEQRPSPVCLVSETETKSPVSGVKLRGQVGHLCRGVGRCWEPGPIPIPLEMGVRSHRPLKLGRLTCTRLN